MDIIWLSSYPRSGNTFLRFLIYSYLYGRIQESAQVERAVPDIHRVLAQGGQLDTASAGLLYVKTHFLMSGSHPYRSSTRGFIYVLRNPRDVLLSNVRYFQMNAAGPFDESSFVRSYIENLGAPTWIRHTMGSWPRHAGTWLAAASSFPCLFLKYEEMRRDTAGTLGRIVRFLNLPCDAERIARAVSQCSLSEMSKLEEKDKAGRGVSTFAGLASDKRFVGDGAMNQPLDRYGPEIVRLFDEKFSRYMELFGY